MYINEEERKIVLSALVKNLSILHYHKYKGSVNLCP
jgi:hypothetical protein